jgi:hypothetical protein
MTDPKPSKELPIIQKTYDLIKWYVPIINRLPRTHRFQIGDRMIAGLYELLEVLITVRFQREKLEQLQVVNCKLDILRYQTRLLADLELFSAQRYIFAAGLLNAIGIDLGNWIKYLKNRSSTKENNQTDFLVDSLNT